MTVRGRWLLAAYPPSFRDRYGDELAALLEDTGVGPRQRVDLLRGALRAWLRPAYGGDPSVRRERRLLSTVSTVWVAWCVVLCGTLGTLRLLEDPAAPDLTLGTTGWVTLHEASTWSLVFGVVVMAVGGLHLGVRVLRASPAARRIMAGPLVALAFVVAGFLAVALWAVSLLPEGPTRATGGGGFVALLAGWTLATAATSVWWTVAVPRALRAGRPPAAQLRLPVLMSPLVVLAMVVPTVLLASVVVGTGTGWGIGFAVVTWVFLAAVIGAVVAGLVSAGRGLAVVGQRAG